MKRLISILVTELVSSVPLFWATVGFMLLGRLLLPGETPKKPSKDTTISKTDAAMPTYSSLKPLDLQSMTLLFFLQ